jgi:hypothetical protein
MNPQKKENLPAYRCKMNLEIVPLFTPANWGLGLHFRSMTDRKSPAVLLHRLTFSAPAQGL